MVGGSLKGLFLTARAAVPLLLASKGRLVVHTTTGDQGRYVGSWIYDVAKYAAARMAFGLANELKAHDVAALTVVLGFTRTERVIAAGAGNQAVESPEFAGRVIAALINDPRVMEKTGRAISAATLAREYDVTDVDGSRPVPFELPEAMKGLEPGLFVR
jgi:NAD(P)-dependent dehydrogenase (short-subunit alcohol dehydrogenase family)